MTVDEFRSWIDPFIWGFFIGFVAVPIWRALKEVWHQAKIAKHEWRNPGGKSN